MSNPSLKKGKKTALITGCSEAGIGPALATALVQTGRYHVFTTARTVTKIPASLRSSDDVTVLALDVTAPDSVAETVKAVSAHTGGTLDLLINNSGVNYSGIPALDLTPEQIKSIFDVNFFGSVAMIQAFAPLLAKAKGMVVNNSSIAGEKCMMYNSIYSAAKAALTIFSECLRLELEPLGIRVMVLTTGVVHTRGLTDQHRFKIPESSLYAPIAADLERIPEVTSKMSAMPAPDYAKQIVKAIEARKVGKVYAGTMAWLFKYMMWWMPTRLWDSANLRQHTYQDKLRTATDKWRLEGSH